MKLKLNQNGTAHVQDGKPVYVHEDGREEAFDGPAAMKLAVGAHFQMSKAASGLKIPAEIAAAAFGGSFRIEKGELVAYTGDVKMYSNTRHGEAANFEEALGQLIDSYPNKNMILREAGAASPSPAPGQQRGSGSTITRAQFDSLPPASRAKFMSEGGRIDDVASSGTPAPTPAPAARAGSITRTQFDGLTPIARAAHFKSGGTMTD